jgi:hypothetical protein
LLFSCAGSLIVEIIWTFVFCSVFCCHAVVFQFCQIFGSV